MSSGDYKILNLYAKFN